MNRFSFFRNIAAALVLSSAGAALHVVLQILLGPADALRIALLVTALGYLAFLLHQLRPPFGVALTIAGGILLALLLLVVNPSLPLWLCVLPGALWLLRCALRYGSLAHCALDAVINGVAWCVGISVVLHTHSLWLGLWSYFLTLAFCVVVPARQSANTPTLNALSAFQLARSSAERALLRLQKNSVHTL